MTQLDPDNFDRNTSPAPPNVRIVMTLVILAASSILLFWGLGHYALWDDEAMTALPALGVWRTGDTVGVLSETFDGKTVTNIVGYGAGAELRDVRQPGAPDPDLRMRYMPPLPNYLAAPFIGMMGRTAFAARLPFAICGLLTIALMLRWLWRDRADTLTWVIFALAVVGNVSLFLYFRNCRYYGLAILLSTALAYIYTHWEARAWQVIAFSFLSLCLLATNYMNFLALYICLIIDYFLWQRRHITFRIPHLLTIAIPQILIGGLIAVTWNPLVVQGRRPAYDWFNERLVLIGLQLRDVNRSEMIIAGLLFAGIFYCLFQRDRFILRGLIAIVVYMLTIALVAPTSTYRFTADVRYLAAAIPLFLAVEVRIVRKLSFGFWLIAIPLALLSFETDFLNEFGLTPKGQMQQRVSMARATAEEPLRWQGIHVTLIDFINELREARGEPYTPVINWIKQNVKPGESIAITPQYMNYPLMFHAPNAIYGWQFPPEDQELFPGLDRVQFSGVKMPDFVISYGNRDNILSTLDILRKHGDVDYQRVDTIDCYWMDNYRPEIFDREFHTHENYDKNNEAIYIYKRVSPPR